jgi:hypothetical protein
VRSLAPALENRYYRVTFDATTGTITGLFDKELNVELVDQAAPHRFNEYLYERFESSDWDAPRAWHRVRTAQLTTSGGPVADVMKVTAVAAGVEGLQQTVILYRDLKRIDFVLDLFKSPSGRRDTLPPTNPLGKESVYVALPFAVPEHAFRHELPGCVSEPVSDLFDGACTAYYAVRHFSDVSNRRYGVTVSAPDSSLIEYDHPRSCPIRSGGEGLFERTKTPPATSRMYLYLMNNMFDVNVRWDQPGPVQSRYSMRSHTGDWQAGRADEFGWDVMNPLIATVAEGKHEGKQQGPLPAASHSFLTIDCPNVACTTIKPAEANGSGFILRFVETQGRASTANVTLSCLPPLAAATETNLIEDDRPHALAIGQGNRLAVSLRPFGVMTIRVTCAPTTAMVTDVKAEAVSDMEVALSWQADLAASEDVSHYHVYRSTQPDFQPSLLNLVQRPLGPACLDRPQLYYGGWINNRLEPDTTYYYRVAAVNRWNNQGAASPPVAITTLKVTDKNMAPLSVACLRAVLVSPLSRFNVVNLLWRTSCESDVRKYEIHRSLTADFTPAGSTCIGLADADAPISGSQAYGHVSVEYRMRDYDHMMYIDEGVQPTTTYYYRVCAVDAAGAKGAYSDEVSVTTKAPDPLALLSPGISAQSVYAPEFGVELATNSLRIFVPASDLPRSDNLPLDGIVRICELLIITPEGKELPLSEAVSR